MQILTVKEACSLLRVCRTTLWNLRKRGDLKGFNVGGKVLFTDEEVNAYIQKQMQKGGQA